MSVNPVPVPTCPESRGIFADAPVGKSWVAGFLDWPSASLAIDEICVPKTVNEKLELRIN